MLRMLISLSLVLLSFFGCAPAAYIPIGSVQNIPVLTDSSNTRFSLNLGSGGISPSMTFVLKNQKMIMSNLSFVNIHTDEECKTCKFTHRFLIEMAYGDFITRSDDQVLEWFVGASYGKSYVSKGAFDFDLWGESSKIIQEKASFIQPFLQLDYGDIDDNSEQAYSVKLVVPYFTNYKHSVIDGGIKKVGNYDNTCIVLLQPAVTSRWGFMHFKGQVQLGFSIPITPSEYARFSIFASLGITINN